MFSTLHWSVVMWWKSKPFLFLMTSKVDCDSLNFILFNSSDVRRLKFSFAIKSLQFSRCFSTIFQEENLADRCRNLIFDLMSSVSRIMWGFNRRIKSAVVQSCRWRCCCRHCCFSLVCLFYRRDWADYVTQGIRAALSLQPERGCKNINSLTSSHVAPSFPRLLAAYRARPRLAENGYSQNQWTFASYHRSKPTATGGRPIDTGTCPRGPPYLWFTFIFRTLSFQFD